MHLNFLCAGKAEAECYRRYISSFDDSSQLRVELRSSPPSPRNRGLSWERSPGEPEQIIRRSLCSRRPYARLRNQNQELIW